MAFHTFESTRLTLVGVPIAESFAMHTALPLAIGRAVAIRAKRGALGEADGFAVAQHQFVPVFLVVAVHAASVESVVHVHGFVIMVDIASQGVAIDKRFVAFHAFAFEYADDGDRVVTHGCKTRGRINII